MHRMQDASSARSSSRGFLLVAILASVLAVAARADVTVQEKTVSSGLGGFGSGSTTTTRVIAGDKGREDELFTYTGKLKTFAGKPRSTSTITRLDKELVWELDHTKQQYGELTFAQMREAMAKGAAQAQAGMKHPEPAREAPKVDFKVDVQRTGKRERINGFDAEQWIITLTAVPREKPQDAAGAPGSYSIKMDQWYSTQVPGQAEVAAYYRRWAEKMGMDPQMRRMATGMMAMHGDAMREMAAKMKDMKGMVVRSTMTMNMDSGLTPEQKAQMAQSRADGAKAQAENKKQRQAKADEDANGDAAGSLARGNVGGALGGFMSRKLGKAAEKKAEASMTSGGSGSGSALTVTTDVLSVTTTSAGASFDVPAGYKKVERTQR